MTLKLVAAVSAPTHEELLAIAKEYLHKNEKAAGLLTPEGIVQNPAFQPVLARLYEKKQEQARRDAEAKEEADRRQHEADAKAAQRELELEMRRDAGMEPLSEEEIAAQIAGLKDSKAILATETTPAAPSVPAKVAEVQSKYASILPAIVFAAWTYASAFRGWLGKQVKNLKTKLEEPGLDENYKELLVERKALFTRLFGAVNEVIEAWGKNPSLDRASYDDFIEVSNSLRGTSFMDLAHLPVPETEEQRQARKTAEAAEQEKREQRNSFKSTLTVRLMAAGVVEDQAKAMACYVAKKYGHCGTDADALKAAAINRKVAAKCEADETVALTYAKAAGITAEELEIEVNTFLQARNDKANAESERRASASFGAVKNDRRSADKKKQQDGGKQKGGKRGKK